MPHFNLKIIFIPALILAFLSLTACGKDSTALETAPPAPTSTPSPTPEPTPDFPYIDGAIGVNSTSPDELNGYDFLSVPTYITKYGDDYFIVDCYHNTIIYSDDITLPLKEWNILDKNLSMPHTISSDGEIYVVDDTESASVKIYAKRDGKFSKTGVFTDIGVRPHFCTYNEKNKTFYILSSMTGEMYLFRRMEGSHKLYLTEVKRLDRLNGIYVRSFTIENDEIIFVSGITPEESGYEPAVVVCDLDSFEIKEEYPVSSAIAGMVQITPIDGKYYITVSTDAYGNAEASRMIAADSLSELSPDN